MKTIILFTRSMLKMIDRYSLLVSFLRTHYPVGSTHYMKKLLRFRSTCPFSSLMHSSSFWPSVSKIWVVWMSGKSYTMEMRIRIRTYSSYGNIYIMYPRGLLVGYMRRLTKKMSINWPNSCISLYHSPLLYRFFISSPLTLRAAIEKDAMRAKTCAIFHRTSRNISFICYVPINCKHLVVCAGALLQ